MKKWFKNSIKKMVTLGVVAFMLVAGWQFGISGTEPPFSEKEVALVKAIARSGGNGGVCCDYRGVCVTPGGISHDSIWVTDETGCE